MKKQKKNVCWNILNNDEKMPKIDQPVSTINLTVSTANRDLTTTHEDWSNHTCEFKQLHKHKVVWKTRGYINQCFNRVTEQKPGQTWPNNIQWRWLNKAKSLPDESQSIDAKFCQQFETLIVGNNTFFPTKRWFRGLWTNLAQWCAMDEVCVLQRSDLQSFDTLAWGEVHIFFSNRKVKQVAKSCPSNQNPLFEVIQQGKLEMETPFSGANVCF